MALVAIGAGIFSMLQTPVYQATADVQLRPNDPREQIDAQRLSTPADFGRFAAVQVDVIKSKAVATEAAKVLGGGVNPGRVQGAISAGTAVASDKMRISVKDGDRVWARDAANAVVAVYIENRRQFAVASLEQAAELIEKKLQELQDRIALLDARIAGKPAPAGAGSTITAPSGGATAFDSPAATPPGGPAPTPDPGAEPTTEEGLKAARYAAAVQYQSLYSRQQDLLVESSLKRGEAELLNQAEIPGSPISPKPLRSGLLGGVVGLMFGLGVAFLREQLDDRVRTREDAEQAGGLPVLAELPFDEAAAQDGSPMVSMLATPHGHFAEAMRGLRTSIQFLGVDEPIKRLVVTSPTRDDGKSVIAANLAAAFALAGLKTVLISADLRRPTVGKLFDLVDENNGLTDLLAAERPTVGGEELKLTDHLRATQTSGLFLMLAGTIPPNPAELLGSRRMQGVIDALSQVFDIVIFDCPPVLAVSDALVLAEKADGVLVVAAAGGTEKGALTRAVELVERTGSASLGLVLNKVEKNSSSYYYGGSYTGYVSPATTETNGSSRSSASDPLRA